MAKIIFTGDVRIADDNKYIDNPLFAASLAEKMEDVDLICCNYEAPIVFNSRTYEMLPKKGPGLGQGIRGFEKLCKSGVNSFCLCNNHIMDYGDIAALETQKIINAKKMSSFGLFSKKERVKAEDIIAKDKKVAIIAVGENGFGCINTIPHNVEYGYQWMFDEDIQIAIKNAHSNSDIVIVMCHGGAENFNYPLPEIRELYRKFIDYGADIVIAHHPHVIQGSELYKNKYIFYSLGNFAFDSIANSSELFNKNGIILKLEINSNNTIIPEVIGTIYENGTISENMESFAEYREYTEGLGNNARYVSEVNKFCLSMYEKVYKHYYFNACSINYKSFLGRTRAALRFFVFGKWIMKFDDLFLFHNLIIETHRWICERAVKLKYFDVSRKEKEK